jgi:hypothetical protein
VFDRCRLFLHTGLPTGHRFLSRRRSFAFSHTGARAVNIIWGAPHLPTRGQRKSAWRRLDRHARTLVNLVEREAFRTDALGFAATDFIITITLSAADASAHLMQNPFAPHFFKGQPVPITLFLVALLGAVFLKGFKEAIGIAVTLVSAYLALNLIVVIIGLEHIAAHPHVFAELENRAVRCTWQPAGDDRRKFSAISEVSVGPVWF